MNRPLLWGIGLGFAFVSIMLEVLFFVSLANTLNDKIITSIIGGLMVACQFAFSGEAVKQWQLRNKPLSVILLLVVCVLFLVSVSGTAGYFESRFLSQNQQHIKNTDAYLMQKQTIAAYEAIAEQQTAKANAFDKEGNPINASRHLKLAQEAIEKAASAKKELALISTHNQTSIEAVAGITGGARFSMWYVLAVVVDLCPILCFVCLGVSSVSPISHPVAREVKEPIKKTSTVKKSRSKDIDSILKQTQEKIIRGDFGSEPGIRQVMEKTGVKSYTRIKGLFDQLQQSGHLARHENGRTFELTKGV